jgi:hypothetical protein
MKEVIFSVSVQCATSPWEAAAHCGHSAPLTTLFRNALCMSGIDDTHVTYASHPPLVHISYIILHISTSWFVIWTATIVLFILAQENKSCQENMSSQASPRQTELVVVYV